ncbi:hypothetical protein [Amycolatopsis australiensis]|uniref:Uncharacterized protein n=1 Tax=Amycolatopsis australiensis TaxID=546364 RepID=A0A1K1SNI0_9PSEU|nr:hypothetical protein [Amycolatopsis australiensis]SFW85968.1 hypothetical protein SAMN04489730_6267 [Amycolatopsis australiensis]
MTTPDDREAATELDRELSGTDGLEPDAQRDEAEREATEDR